MGDSSVENEAIMSLIEVVVPTTRPTIPKTIRKRSFQNIYQHFPNLSGQSRQISIIAGKAMPSAERQRAPNKEMNKPNLGIATANKTANSKIETKTSIRAKRYSNNNNKNI